MKKNIIIAALAVVLCFTGLFGCAQSSENDADKIVGEYTENPFSGFEEIIGDSDAFDLGVNSYGVPIFADRDKAYEQMLSTCEKGIEAVRKKGNLPRLGRNKDSFPAYSDIGSELSEGDYSEDIIKQAAFIGVFYDIYENSDDEYYTQ